MNTDIHACEAWKKAYEFWRSNPDRRMHELPPKPPGYDLWLQGDNPLKLEISPATSTSLVDPNWQPVINHPASPSITHDQLRLPIA